MLYPEKQRRREGVPIYTIINPAPHFTFPYFMFYSCSGTVASLAGIPEEKVSIEVRNYNVKNKCFLVQPLELNVLRLIFYNIFKFIPFE